MLSLYAQAKLPLRLRRAYFRAFHSRTSLPARFGQPHSFRLDSSRIRVAHFSKTPHLSRAPWRPPPTLTRRGPLAQLADMLNRIPTRTIANVILGLNAGVFLMWQWAIYELKDRRPEWAIWMRKNFLASRDNLSAGRVWTLVTCAFSQNEIMHFALNCLTFYWMAPPVLQLLGGAEFLALYFGGALMCSGTTLALAKYSHKASHGASGAIFAIITTYACAFPRSTFMLYGIIPAPAWACVGGLIAWNGYHALEARNDPHSPERGKTNYIGHLAGAVAGAAYFLFRLRFRRI